MLTRLFIKITISSLVIGLKKSYFSLIHLPSFVRQFVIEQLVIGQFVIGQFTVKINNTPGISFSFI